MKFYQAVNNSGVLGVQEVFKAMGIDGTVNDKNTQFTAKKWNVTLTVDTKGIIHISSSTGAAPLKNSFSQINMGTHPSCYAVITDNFIIINSSVAGVSPIVLINTDTGTFAMSTLDWDYKSHSVCCTYNADGRRASTGTSDSERENRPLISGNLGTTISVSEGKAVVYMCILRKLYVTESIFVVPDLFVIYSNVVKTNSGPFIVNGKQYEAVQVGNGTVDGSVIWYFAVPYRS